jgi:hypothetical protein
VLENKALDIQDMKVIGNIKYYIIPKANGI